MAQQVEFFVNTSQLMATAGELSSTGSSISNLTSEMMNLSGQLASCSSESMEIFINKLRGLETSIQTMNRMIQEHVSDIETIVRNYESTEQTNVQEAEALQTDIIS